MTSPNYTDPLQKSPQRSAMREAGQAAKDQATQVWNQTRDSARSMLDERQKAAASGIGEFAGALRKAAQGMEQQQPMSRMIESAADGLERFSGSLRDKDLDTLVRDAESLARRQPVAFFGAAILAGFLAARFVKASRREGEATEPPQRTPTV